MGLGSRVRVSDATDQQFRTCLICWGSRTTVGAEMITDLMVPGSLCNRGIE